MMIAWKSVVLLPAWIVFVFLRLQDIHAFLTSFAPLQSHQQRYSDDSSIVTTHSTITKRPSFSYHFSVSLKMSNNNNNINLQETDPFVVLNLSPTSNPKEIKRAYKRMALQYHPDVVCNSSSTPQERRHANDVFAKINWAYQQLNGKQQTSSTSASATQQKSTSTYTPPHRRTTSTTRNKDTTFSTDWRDYIPNYQNEEKYNVDGDSFGAILSDLMSGMSGMASSGGIFRDLVEFLEANVDGYSSGGDEEEEDLDTLLTTGTLQQVGMEMDDTQLVVQSLESKQRNVADELLIKTADLKFADKFSQRVELQERIAELQARKRVVDSYLKKARKRLLSLQTRYKELIVRGERDSTFSSSTTSRGSSTREGSYNSSSRTSSFSSTGGTASSTSDASTRASSSTTSNDENAWKTQGFGSSGRRGRGSSRRGTRQSSAGAGTTTDKEQRVRQPSSSSYRERPPSSPPRPECPSSSSYSTSPPRSTGTSTSSTRLKTSTTTEEWKAPVPPHRRTRSEPSQALRDKNRLRELQVDEEFDKLKKELGL